MELLYAYVYRRLFKIHIIQKNADLPRPLRRCSSCRASSEAVPSSCPPPPPPPIIPTPHENIRLSIHTRLPIPPSSRPVLSTPHLALPDILRGRQRVQQYRQGLDRGGQAGHELLRRQRLARQNGLSKIRNGCLHLLGSLLLGHLKLRQVCGRIRGA